MGFNGTADTDIPGNVSKKDLIDNMKLIDDKLLSSLENVKEDKTIVWFGEKKSVSYHLTGLITHEALHIGQIIAFCYALDIKLSDDVIENWALSGR